MTYLLHFMQSFWSGYSERFWHKGYRGRRLGEVEKYDHALFKIMLKSWKHAVKLQTLTLTKNQNKIEERTAE